jgi:hypothetical protein
MDLGYTYQNLWWFVQQMDTINEKKEVRRMREFHEDLMVLEEGHEAGVVQGCCGTGNMAKL